MFFFHIRYHQIRIKFIIYMAEYIAYKHYTSIYPSLYSPVEGCLSDQSQLATTSEWPVFTFVHCHIASKRPKPKPRLFSIQKRQTDCSWEDFLSQSSSRVLSLVAIQLLHFVCGCCSRRFVWVVKSSLENST